jgi:hypothetical protein
MKVLVGLNCCLLLSFQIDAVPAPVSPQDSSTPSTPTALVEGCKQPSLEDGTAVRLRFAHTVSSAVVYVNDLAEFEVLEETGVSVVLIVPTGGIAWTTVTEEEPKRRMARGGKLENVMDSVRLSDGEKASLRATKVASAGGHNVNLALVKQAL